MRAGSRLDELADLIDKREVKVPVKMQGSTTAGGTDIEVQNDRLPLPLGDVGDVATIIDDGGDIIVSWEPGGSSLIVNSEGIAVLDPTTELDFVNGLQASDAGSGVAQVEPVYGLTAGTIAEGSDLAAVISDVAALGTSSHAAATVSDTSSINLTLAGQAISADIIDSYVQGLIDDSLSPLIIEEASSLGTPAATTAEVRLDAGTGGIQTLGWKSDEPFEYVIGRDTYLIVKNVTGSTIPAGTPVYINGVSSGVPTIAKAKADDLTTAKVAGVLADSIVTTGFGRCFAYGFIGTMDTSAFAAGDTLYLSAATAGAVTATAPGALNYNIKLGQVLTVGNPGNFLVQLELLERTILTTKGDLLTRSSVQDVRQPVGADGTIVSADSATSTGLNFVNVNTLITSTADPSFVALTPPINGNFSWINQGAATVSTTDGGILLTTAAAAGVNVHLRVMTAPATPYIVTALFTTNMPTETSGVNGLFWRQSSDGKLASCVVSGTTNIPRAQSTKYTNPTTFSAVYNSVFLPTYHKIWLRIEDNGTNRMTYYSYDGLHFQLFHTVGRTDFLTADQIGFAMDANSALYGQQMWLLSWKIT